MPTVLSHAAVPLAIGIGFGRKLIPARLLIVGIVASMLPDSDVVGLRLGIPYADAFGHRGASHSIVAAAFVGLIGGVMARQLRTSFVTAFLFLFLSMASHGLLDMATNGGHGVALLWPWTEARLFAPYRPIEVSPLAVSRIFSPQLVEVLSSELIWIWLPCAVLALVLRTASSDSRLFTRRI